MAANKLVKVHAAVGERVFVATFKPTTGHLRVLEGDRTLLAMSAPDSWMALATQGGRRRQDGVRIPARWS
jgi:hypothetical protein